MLQIINVSDFGLVNDIFYIAPQEKIQGCNIRGTWQPSNMGPYLDHAGLKQQSVGNY